MAHPLGDGGRRRHSPLDTQMEMKTEVPNRLRRWPGDRKGGSGVKEEMGTAPALCRLPQQCWLS